MRNVRILAALGLLSAAGAANAEVSATVTATSDYDYRGFTQTDEDPALQASIDYADDSGWYIGAWGSNVDFGPGDPNAELDVYTGFSGGEEDGLGWDVGIVGYFYPSASDINFAEIYGGLSHGMFSTKLWYSNDFGGSSEDAMYLQGDVEVPLPQNFSLALHAGYSFGDYWDTEDTDEYFDYSVGVGYSINNFDLSLRYVDTDINDFDGDRVIFTVSTTFPWGD
jgi:uncharacterized protein (TIGR02001 family)